MNFNPRTREGCDPQLSLHAGQCRPDFNPRTREGCDDDSEEIGIEVIHISIHAPVKGATHRCRNREQTAAYFNPRTREGCDKKYLRCSCLR